MVDGDDVTSGLLLTAYIAGSSVLGLASRGLAGDPAGTIRFVGEVWSASLVADLAFVGGMAAAGMVGARLARERRHTLLAMGASLGLALATYWMAFLLLPDGSAGGIPGGTSALEALRFVATWGAPGLVLATLAPALWIRAEEVLWPDDQRTGLGT